MKKKLNFCIILSLFLTSFISAQTIYKVLFNDGNVIINDSLISKGAFFKNTDSVYFKNNKGLLKVCYSSCSKIKIIAGDLYSNIHSSSIDDYISYYETTSTRDRVILNIKELNDLFSLPNIAVLDSLKLSFNNNVYLIDSNKYFYLRFINNGRTYNKKLKVINDEIIISQYAFTIDNVFSHSFENSVSIYYYDQAAEESTLVIPDVKLVFIDKNLIINNVKYVFENLNLSKNEKLEFLRDYLRTEYKGLFFNYSDCLKLLEL
ncbi:MAG: hypothetical protein GYB35_09945 [Algicola sp.]|nr:hypothetical protein [Algicola sp.]